MKNTITKIIAGLLAIAIVLTGVSVDATTAHAAMTYEQYMRDTNNVADYQDTPFTMEIGDKKRFELVENHSSYWMEKTKLYKWSVSDESVITMEVIHVSATDERIEAFRLIAQKAGTATVTGTLTKTDGTTKTVSMTVIVKGATTKQKSCKHKWKTTKKATCMGAGQKTCKRCHLKKSIKRKAHAWETTEKTVKTYPTYAVYYCMDCDTRFDPYDYGWTGPLELGGDLEKNKAADKAAYDAYQAHIGKCEDYKAVKEAGGRALNNWYFLEETDYKHPITKKVTVTRCTTCGYTPEEAKQYE